MNCEKCHELLSDFLEGTLTDKDRTTLSTHLDECLSCVGVRDELDGIVTFCREHRGEYVAPPNEKALWLRIRNTIESETVRGTAAAGGSAASASHKSFWSRLMGQSWELSLPQLAAALVLIVSVVSVSTFFGVRRMQSTEANNPSSPTMARNNSSISAKDAQFLIEGRMREQQQAIAYWTQRVERRKAQWDPQMREAFERSLNVIDQAVKDSRDQLMQNPHDEVSEEMLNAALTDKMELLKEFADQ